MHRPKDSAFSSQAIMFRYCAEQTGSCLNCANSLLSSMMKLLERLLDPSPSLLS
jgi:hypothetical protein